MKKDVLVFIEHILDSIEKIERFMNRVSKSSFIGNEEKQSAVIRQIEIIGEAVKNLPSEFRNKYSDIPWVKIAGMRDKLMHDYFGVNLDTVWKVVKEDIQVLEKQILKIKDDLKSANISNETETLNKKQPIDKK